MASLLNLHRRYRYQQLPPLTEASGGYSRVEEKLGEESRRGGWWGKEVHHNKRTAGFLYFDIVGIEGSLPYWSKKYCPSDTNGDDY